MQSQRQNRRGDQRHVQQAEAPEPHHEPKARHRAEPCAAEHERPRRVTFVFGRRFDPRNELRHHRRIERRLVTAASRIDDSPLQLAAGPAGLYAPRGVDEQDRDAAQRIMAAAGSTVWLDEESGIDDITAISGSGPAYVFALIPLPVFWIGLFLLRKGRE